uniref:Uncharacterized protein n=1 Tax=Anopheles coluzzii TaxID=1518534 RepID=A0A8W7PID3_ANOCL
MLRPIETLPARTEIQSIDEESPHQLHGGPVHLRRLTMRGGQGCPPLRGCVTIDRTRSERPVPQVTEQGVHSDQSDSTQSTGRTSNGSGVAAAGGNPVLVSRRDRVHVFMQSSARPRHGPASGDCEQISCAVNVSYRQSALSVQGRCWFSSTRFWQRSCSSGASSSRRVRICTPLPHVALHGLQSLQAVTGQSGSGASMSVIEQSGCMHFCFSTAEKRERCD